MVFIGVFKLEGQLQLRFSVSRHQPRILAFLAGVKAILDDRLERPLHLVGSGRRLDGARFPVLLIEHVSLLRDVVRALRYGLDAENQ